MRLLRVGQPSREVPCVLDASGRARDISGIVTDISPETIPDLPRLLAQVEVTSLPLVATRDRRIGPPLTQPRNIYCIGLNYSDHATEAGLAVPSEPILFNKAACTFCGPTDPILFASRMKKLDWEVELGIVIGKPALNISRSEATAHVLGFTVVNDVSERSWQMERGGQWSKGKSFPNFCPTGPWIVTPDELQSVQNLDMWLDVNGQRCQTGNTGRMIFDIATIVSHLSEFTRLEPGDLICTGTPPGVGAGMKPQKWLTVGDRVSLGISGLGRQDQIVTALQE